MPLHIGLSLFNKAVRDRNSEAGFINFVKYYGTHYKGEAEFGSSFYFEKWFNSRSRNKSQQTDRERCVAEGSKNCGGGNLSMLGVSAHAQACSEDFEDRCSVTLVRNIYLIYSAI